MPDTTAEHPSVHPEALANAAAALDLPAGAAFVSPQADARSPQASHLASARTVLIYSCVAAAFLPALVLYAAFRGTSQLLVAAPLFAAFAGWGIWAWRAKGKRLAEDEAALGAGFAFADGSDARVRIACSPGWGAALLRGRDLGAAFEPEIARVPLALGVSGSDRWLAALGAVAGVVATLALGGMLMPTPMLSSIIWAAMGAAGIGAAGLPEFCAPTYVRIVPGRLDVLRFSLFRRRPASLASFDLRRSRVLVDVRRAAVIIEPPGEHAPPRKVRSKRWPYAVVEEPGGRADAVSLILTPARRRLLEAACHAAITPAPTPELPPDELLG